MATDVTKLTDAQATTAATPDKTASVLTTLASGLDGCSFFFYKGDATNPGLWCRVSWPQGGADVKVNDTGIAMTVVRGLLAKLWILATGS